MSNCPEVGTTDSNIRNVVSVDVENWNSRPLVRKFGRGKSKDEYNMDGVLEGVRDTLAIFEKHNRTGTFFVLGTVANACPEAVELIAKHGHEIAIHGFHHRQLAELGKDKFEAEIQKSSSMIKKITGNVPRGFRAPNFSMTKETGWALDILEREGFSYDSSVMPGFNISSMKPTLGLGRRVYGLYKASHVNPFRSTTDSTDRIFEFPTIARRLLMLDLPAGGGFYLRVLGHDFILKAISNLNKRGASAMCYLHNWEISGIPNRGLPPGISQLANFGMPIINELSHIL